jgi:hypothetical protein
LVFDVSCALAENVTAINASEKISLFISKMFVYEPPIMKDEK